MSKVLEIELDDEVAAFVYFRMDYYSMMLKALILKDYMSQELEVKIDKCK